MAKKKSGKERRRIKRTKTPEMALGIDGKKCPTRNLGIGGSLISGYGGPLPADPAPDQD